MSLPRKHVGVYYKCSPGASEEVIEAFTQKAQGIARQLEDFWRYHSHGLWDVQCEGFALPATCDPRPPYMCSLEAKKIDTGDFKPNHWHVVDNVSVNYCGQGQYLGDISVNYYYMACGISTTDHELGHNVGLMHDGTRDSEGNEREYGKTSIMGSNRPVYGLCSPHNIRLGFESEREILQVEGTQQVLIAPTEMSKLVLHNDEWQTIRIGQTYLISLRKQKGTRYPNRQKAEALYIHHIDLRDRGNAKFLIPALMVGDERVIPSGQIIKYHEYNEETARVTIQYPDEPSPVDLAMPHGPPVTLQSSRITEAHSGAWWNRDFDGQGFVVMVVGERVAVYNYTFDQEGGTQRYYMGTGIIRDGACEMEWYTTKDGTFDDPTTHEKVRIGKAQLFFNDDTTGVFHFNTTEYGRGAVNIELLAKTVPSDFNGAWYHSDRDGEGLSIQQFDNLLAVYWYNCNKQGEQKWYSIVGEPDNMKIHDVTGGRWLFYDDITKPVIGTASIMINRGGGITFKYDSPVLGTGLRMMSKLF